MQKHGILRLLLQVTALLIATAALPASAGDGFRLALLGDSLTVGYGLDAGDAFPARLAEALAAEGLEGEILDHGISGDTTHGGLARIEWMLSEKPTHVLVELGANDALRGLDPELTRNNLEAILAALQKAGVHTILAGMQAPPNLGRRYVEAFNSLFPDLAGTTKTPYLGFFLEGVANVPELNQDDGTHPNAKGVRVLVRRMAPLISDWLRQTGG